MTDRHQRMRDALMTYAAVAQLAHHAGQFVMAPNVYLRQYGAEKIVGGSLEIADTMMAEVIKREAAAEKECAE